MTEVMIQLSDDVRTFVEEQVASRRLANASEFIASLLHEAQRNVAIQRVDQLLIDGLASGPGEEATPEWWAQTRAEHLQRRPGAIQP